MKFYKFTKGVFLHKKCLVTTGNIIAVDKKVKDKISCKIQGKSGNTNIDESLFNELLANNLLEVELSKDEYYSLIEPNRGLREKKELLIKLKKEYPYFESMLSTLDTWIFQAKGSDCATYDYWIKFQKNPDEIITEKVKSGFSAKPGKPVMNRSQRNTAVSDEEKWSKDLSCILPYGIRKSDFADYYEQERIFDKLLKEFLSLDGVPIDMINYVLKQNCYSSIGFKISPSTHRDYWTDELLNVSLFEKNEHHSKEKGLELCHIDPNLDFTTVSSNLTIGFSSSNREQGGYSLKRRECSGLRLSILEMSKIKNKNIDSSKVNNLVELGNSIELIKILLDIGK